MSTRADITAADGWFNGEDKTFVYTITNKNTSLPQDITGWTIQFKVSATIHGDAMFTLNAALTTPSAGVCSIFVASSYTLNITPGTYYYDLRKLDTGSRAILAYGTAEILDPYVAEVPW